MFRIFLITLSIGLLLFPQFSFSQETPLKDLLDDGKAMVTMDNAWWLLAGTGLTLLAREVEDPEGAIRALDHGLIDPMVDFGNIWGDIRLQFPLALGAWTVGSVADKDQLALFGYDLTRGLLITYGAVSVGKYAVQRTRPNGDPYSFPSGHTSTAFTIAGVLSRHYGPWAGAAGVSLGVLTGLGRMEDNRHFASDVVAGATIGWIVGRTVARDRKSGESAWQLVPSVNGLVLVGRFN